MKINAYRKNTGEFLFEIEAAENPRRKGSYLIPENHTEKPPLPEKEGYVIIFQKNGKVTEILSEDGEWVYKFDLRGQTAWVKDTSELIKIDYLGELKDEHTFVPCPGQQNFIWDYGENDWRFDIETAQTDKVHEIKISFDNALKGFMYSETLQANINADRDSLQNIDGILSVITDYPIQYRVYDNSFVMVPDKSTIEAMKRELVLHGQNLYYKKWQLEEAVVQATTQEALENIKW